MTTEDAHGGPWYIHFWPWFIVLLLGTAVTASLWSLLIAVEGADSLVSDDYYKNGKAINRSLAADHEAALREATAAVSIDGGIVIALSILGDFPDALELELSHVTLADRDRSVRLERTTSGRYAAPEPLPDGRFYATLRPAGDAPTWRLHRRVDLPGEREFEMEPGG